MSRHILFATALVAFLMPQLVQAKGNSCRLLSALAGYHIEDCTCGKKLAPYRSNDNTIFPLTALCGFSEDPTTGPDGAQLFEGNVTLTGTIDRQETKTFGDTVRFVVEASSRESLPTVHYDLRFTHDKLAVKAFGVPPITKRTPCWTAKASIQLKQLYVLDGPGTDSEGGFIVDYEVSRIGPIKKCKSSE